MVRFKLNFIFIYWILTFVGQRSALELLCSHPVQNLRSKKPRLELEEEELSEEDEADEDGVLDATVDIRLFMPLHLCASREEPVTTLQRVSMAIILPLGVEPQRVTVRVIEGGKQI